MPHIFREDGIWHDGDGTLPAGWWACTPRSNPSWPAWYSRFDRETGRRWVAGAWAEDIVSQPVCKCRRRDNRETAETGEIAAAVIGCECSKWALVAIVPGYCLLEAWRIPPEFSLRDVLSSEVYKMSEKIKKALAGAKKAGPTEAANDPELERSAPILHEFLTLAKGEGGRARKTSSITVFAADGAFKACLNDRETGFCLWAEAATLAGLPEALEEQLGSESVPWRVSASNARVKGNK
jgi:hypothetical protein